MFKKAALVIILVSVLPFLTQLVLQKEYKVHEKGAIIISGASTGIGKHAAVDLAKHGYTVFAGVRKQKDADALKSESGGLATLIPFILDVAKQETVTNSFHEVKKYLDANKIPLVGLVNNAGISQTTSPVEFIDVDKAKQEFDVNYFGVIRLVKQFLPLLRTSQGRVVNVGSIAGVIAIPNNGVYSSTKFALEAVNDVLRRETAKWGISVSLIEPAYVKTQIGAKALDNSPLKHLSKEQITLYQHTLANVDEERIKNFELADTCTVTTDVIVHALTSAYPKTRYVVAKVGKVPAFVLAKAIQYIPDRLADILFSFF